MRRPNTRHVAPVLFTIGYERHASPALLVEKLQAAGVARLVDVRDLPMSRRRGFSKRALAQALETAGVAYEHERALGNPKSYRDLYRAGHRAAGERLYRAHLRNGSSDAVARLLQTLPQQVTCLMCYEHDPADCHRAVIIEELLSAVPTLGVEHL